MAGSDITEANIEDLQGMDAPAGPDETADKDGQAAAGAAGPKDQPTGKRAGIISRICVPVWKQKWVIVSIALSLGALVAIGLTLAPGLAGKEKTKTPAPAGSTIFPESLKEENLAPFFIPLSGDKNRRMVRVDLSAVWSALASIKYRKNEIRIRDQMFGHLRSLTREKKDLNASPDLLENRLEGVLRNSLGIYDLEVKVREINYF